MLKASLRSAWAHVGRLLLSAVAVILGVAFVSGSFMLTDSLDRTFQSIVSGAAQDVRVTPAAEGSGGRGSIGPNIGADLVPEIEAVPGVAAAGGVASGGGAFLVDAAGELVGAAGPPAIGFSWQSNPELSVARIVEGVAPTQPNEIAVDSLTFDSLGQKIGDEVRVIGPDGPFTARLVGRFNFGDSGGLAGATLTAFTPAQAQQLFAEPGQWNSVDVAVTPGVPDAVVADRVRENLGDGYSVSTRSEQISVQNEALQEGLAFVTYVIGGFAAIALFVAAFLIYNTFAMLVTQRGRELALMRAIGATRAQVLGSILVEALLVGLVAACLGLGVGVLLAVGLAELFTAIGLSLTAGVQVSFDIVLLALLVGVGVTVAAAFMPAFRAGRTLPVAALLDTVADRDKLSIWRPLVAGAFLAGGGYWIWRSLPLAAEADRVQGVALGLLLLTIAAIGFTPLLGVGLVRLVAPIVTWLGRSPGKLASRNARRSPGRLAATATALLVGVALVVAATVIAASARQSLDELVDETYGAEFLVGSITGRAFEPDIAREIGAQPAVGAAVAVSGGPLDLEGDSLRAVAVGGGPIESVFSVQPTAGEFVTPNENQVLVDSVTAQDIGWSVGDQLLAGFPDGNDYSLELVGTFAGSELLQGAIVNLDSYRARGGPGEDRSVLVTVAPGVSSEVAAEQIRAATAANPLIQVLDQTQLKEQNAQQINQILYIIYALLALSVIIAILGVLNTLVLAVLERTREIGLLRAVGATRRQIRAMIRWEAVLISCLGTTLGVLLGIVGGVLLQQSLVSTGISALVIPRGTILVILAVAVLVGILSALLPARRAAKLNLLAAITVS